MPSRCWSSRHHGERPRCVPGTTRSPPWRWSRSSPPRSSLARWVRRMSRLPSWPFLCRVIGHQWGPSIERRIWTSSTVRSRCRRCPAIRELSFHHEPRRYRSLSEELAGALVEFEASKARRAGTAATAPPAPEATPEASTQPLDPRFVSGTGVVGSWSCNVDHGGSPCDWSTGARAHSVFSTSTQTHSYASPLSAGES
jgi:hypothetical protein